MRAVPAILAALIALPAPAALAEAGLQGEVRLVSDYVDRGVSNSDNHPALQGSIGWLWEGGAYVSVWGSSVDFDDGDEATVELDYVLGNAGAMGPVEYDVSVARITYPGASGALDYDLWEGALALAVPLGPVTLGSEAIYTPENAGGAGDALYLRGILEVPLDEALTLSAHLGRQWLSREAIAGPDYTDWGAGLAWTRGSLTAGLAYTDTDLGAACERLCDSRVTLEISLALP
ncbi:MAG TPA: TorF family putative porin [Azospirillaceae bacterium]|nr:TorF family putative porin [Azospirillaceae bacterium]